MYFERADKTAPARSLVRMRQEIYEERRARRQQEIDAQLDLGNTRSDGRAMSTDAADEGEAEPPALEPLPPWEETDGPGSCAHLENLRVRFRTLSPPDFATMMATHQGALEENTAELERIREDGAPAAELGKRAVGVGAELRRTLGEAVRSMVVTVEGFEDDDGEWGLGAPEKGLSPEDIDEVERAGLLLVLFDLGVSFQRLGKERGTFGLWQPPT